MQSARSYAARPVRIVALALALAAAAGLCHAAGFRGVAWGASQEEVRSTETHPLHHDYEGELAYWNFEFAGVEAGLVYVFEDDRLVRARFVSRHRTSRPEEDMADYEAFKAQLEEHFGPAESEEWVWADGAERAEGEGSVAAIASGEVVLESRWTLDDTTVRLLSAAENGVVETVRAVFEPL